MVGLRLVVGLAGGVDGRAMTVRAMRTMAERTEVMEMRIPAALVTWRMMRCAASTMTAKATITTKLSFWNSVSVGDMLRHQELDSGSDSGRCKNGCIETHRTICLSEGLSKRASAFVGATIR